MNIKRKKIIIALSIIGIFGILSASNIYNNYQCQKCGLCITSNTTPRQQGCRDTHPFHRWYNLGEAGNTAYQCKYCGTLIYSKSQPRTQGCPSNTFHQWQRY